MIKKTFFCLQVLNAINKFAVLRSKGAFLYIRYGLNVSECLMPYSNTEFTDKIRHKTI